MKWVNISRSQFERYMPLLTFENRLRAEQLFAQKDTIKVAGTLLGMLELRLKYGI